MRPHRALLAALALLALVSAAAVLYQKGPTGLGWFPGCTFYKLTGLYCPGCGMTRATHASLHGDFPKAFAMNPVGMVLFPLAVAGIGFEILAWVRNRPDGFRLNVGPRVSYGIAATVILFWILRNIPIWPFTLLAPH